MKLNIRLIRGAYWFVQLDSQGDGLPVNPIRHAWRQSTYRGLIGKRVKLALDEVY